MVSYNPLPIAGDQRCDIEKVAMGYVHSENNHWYEWWHEDRAQKAAKVSIGLRAPLTPDMVRQVSSPPRLADPQLLVR